MYARTLSAFSLALWLSAVNAIHGDVSAAELRLTSFAIDVTPAAGSPLAYDPMIEATEPLQLKGIVLVFSLLIRSAKALFDPELFSSC